jgi:hypothetical protein
MAGPAVGVKLQTPTTQVAKLSDHPPALELHRLSVSLLLHLARKLMEASPVLLRTTMLSVSNLLWD